MIQKCSELFWWFRVNRWYGQNSDILKMATVVIIMFLVHLQFSSILIESTSCSNLSDSTVHATTVQNRSSCGTVTLTVLGQFSDICGPQGYGFHPIKNLRNCELDFVAPFNSNFDNKMLCESGVMWIIRFVTYLSIAFHIYLLIIIHFQLIIITNVSRWNAPRKTNVKHMWTRDLNTAYRTMQNH